MKMKGQQALGINMSWIRAAVRCRSSVGMASYGKSNYQRDFSTVSSIGTTATVPRRSVSWAIAAINFVSDAMAHTVNASYGRGSSQLQCNKNARIHPPAPACSGISTTITEPDNYLC